MAEISPLRRRMIEDMTVRNLSPATQQSYLNAVSKFSRYFGRSPDRLGLEDVHSFQVHLCQSAPERDPRSASKRDPFERRVLAVALAPSELVGVAETGRARVVGA